LVRSTPLQYSISSRIRHKDNSKGYSKGSTLEDSRPEDIVPRRTAVDSKARRQVRKDTDTAGNKDKLVQEHNRTSERKGGSKGYNRNCSKTFFRLRKY
jgi:hypothetical protein